MWLAALLPAHAFQPDFFFGVIQGRVTPAPGEEGLPKQITATLSIRERSFTVTTEVRSGIFKFTDLDDGNYTITVQAPGYLLFEQTLSLSGARRGVVVDVTISLGESLAGSPDLPSLSGEKTVSTGWLKVPKKALTELAKAEKASRTGNLEKAIRHLKKALDFHPDFPQAQNNLGVQYMKLGRVDEAIHAFLQALKYDPGDNSANFNLGLIYSLRQQHDLALPRLQATVQHDPGNFKAMALLAESRFNLGDFGLALESYQKAVELQPAQPELLLRVADCLTQLSRFQEAIAVLRDFLDKASEHSRAPTIRAQIRHLEALDSPG